MQLSLCSGSSMNSFQILDMSDACSSNSSTTTSWNIESSGSGSSFLPSSQNIQQSTIYAIKDTKLQAISAFEVVRYTYNEYSRIEKFHTQKP